MRQSRVGQFTKVRLRGVEVFRNLVVRKHRPGKVHLQVTHFGNSDGVVDRLGNFGKKLPHLRFGFDVVFVGDELGSVLLVFLFIRAYANKDVLSVRVFLCDIVAVVGRYQRNTGFLRDVDERLVDNPFFRHAVIGQLEIEIVGSEEVPVEECPLPRVLHPVADYQLRDISDQGTGECDEPFVIFFEDFVVYPRLIVEPFQVTD